MKRIKTILLLGILMVTLIACGSSQVKLNEAIDKSQEQIADLSNLKMSFTILADINSGGEQQEMFLDATVVAENIYDEKEMNSETVMVMNVMGININTTVYKVGDIAYIDLNGIKSIEEYANYSSDVDLNINQFQGNSSPTLNNYFTSEQVNGEIIYTSKEDKLKGLLSELYSTGSMALDFDKESDEAYLEWINSKDTKVTGQVQYIFTEGYLLKEIKMDYIIAGTLDGEEYSLKQVTNIAMNYTAESQLVLPEFDDWGKKESSNTEGVELEEGVRLYLCDGTAGIDEVRVKVNGEEIEYFIMTVSQSYEDFGVTKDDAALVLPMLKTIYEDQFGEGIGIDIETDDENEKLKLHLQIDFSKISEDELELLGISSSDIEMYKNLKITELDMGFRVQGCELAQ